MLLTLKQHQLEESRSLKSFVWIDSLNRKIKVAKYYTAFLSSEIEDPI